MILFYFNLLRSESFQLPFFPNLFIVILIYLLMYENIFQLLGELGVQYGQQSILHPVHVLIWIIRPSGRHHFLLRQHPTRRQKSNRNLNSVDFLSIV